MALGCLAPVVLAEATVRPPGAPELPIIAKECGEVAAVDTPLPNSSSAIQKHQKLKILAIGASSAAVLGNMRDGKPPLLEQILERTIKGLDVEIINRGFSGNSPPLGPSG